MIELFIYLLVALWSYHYLSKQEPTLFNNTSVVWNIIAILVSPILSAVYWISTKVED